MTREELMTDGTQYCCYCGDEKVRFQCCGEAHFETFAQMDKDEQDEFQDDGNIDQVELIKRAEDAFNRSKWVGLTDEEIWSVYTQVDSMQYMEFSHAIEAKLQEKNT